MKIPESVRIGGVEYTVCIVRGLNDGQRMLAGQISYNDCVIEIEANGNHQYKCLSLWHEIMHGIETQEQLDLGAEKEKIIEAFARGVYQVLQDNGKRLFDIREPEPCVYGAREGRDAHERG